jgi:dipeptidase
MKKIFLSALCYMLFTTSSNIHACTNFLVTKGASKDGSTFITYAADSHTLYGELYYRPAANYPAGTMMDIYEWDSGKKLGQIKQAIQTYSVVGNINEHQVAIGETTFTGLDTLQDKRGIIDYGSLIYITLQRAKTAREAIMIFHQLVSEYGYYSTGESFSISDPNEVWILEMIGKGSPILDKKGNVDTKAWTLSPVWVAMRIPDGYVSGHANQARITTFPLENGKTSISTKTFPKYSIRV